jgi:hypothetical protein
MVAASRALNVLIPNHMERRDKNCIWRTSARVGEKTELSRAMCKEDQRRRVIVIFAVLRQELTIGGLACTEGT